MDPMALHQIIMMLGQKGELTGPEHMLYVTTCECFELWVRHQNVRLRKELEAYDSEPDPDGST